MIGSLVAAAMGILQHGSTELTVYNQGLGFVKDIRLVDLKKGTQGVRIEDVAQLIDASSVGFKCLNNPGSVSVLEQNYQYDLVSPEAILQKSIGKRIRLTRTVGNSKETVEGTLVSSPNAVVNTGGGSEYQYNGLVLKTDDGRILLSPQGEIDVMEMPEGLISKPSLLWQVESADDQNAKMELSYLTKGISWSANYVLTLNTTGLGDLQGWATIDNRSGASFKDAQLKLMAGELNIVRDQPVFNTVSQATPASAAAIPAEGFRESGLFEYHLYTLQRPATIKNNESKQLSLLEGFNIPVTKIVAFDGYANSGDEQVQNLDSNVRIKFVNDEKSHLGMPMPAGKVRLYQRDKAGSVQFLGEDQIDHTPKGETLRLTVGKAFDVKATHKRTTWTKVSKNLTRMDFEVEVRNRKQEAQTVYLYEHLDGDWKITKKTQDYIKDDSNTIVFEVKLAAGQVGTVKYTVEVKS